MSEIKQKRLQILLKLFGDQIKQRIETEKLKISEKELLNKFSDYEITESGKYLEWMTKAYIGNGFLYEDLYKVKETLEIFHDNKMKLSKDKRDIQQYKTLAALWIEVKKFVEQNDDFLSTNEQKRKAKELAYSETEFLYEDDNLRIVVPLTKESSKWWGKGTRWCTAAKNKNMFMHYFKYSPLLIFDFKDGEKWQLWLWLNDNLQFMDENDQDLIKNKIQKRWQNIESIFIKLLEINGFLLKYIPEKLITKELYEIALKQNDRSFYYIPDKLKTKELYEMIIKQDYETLRFISDELKTKELCELAINQNGNALVYIPKKFRTKELYESAVKQNGESLSYIPEDLKIKELCEMAVKQNGTALQYVPENLRTKELCEIAVKKNGEALSSVPSKLKTEELCKIAVQQNGLALYYISKKLMTKELCEIAVKQNGLILEYIPNKYKTQELCEIAVKQNGIDLYYVPKKMRRKEICEIAVKQNGNALFYVPLELKTYELCEIAIRQNNKALEYVPKKFITKELCELAKKQKEDSIIVNNHLKKYIKIFSELMQKDNLNLGN